MTFEGITMETYEAFKLYCNKKNYSENYAGSLIKDWKALMNHTKAKGWHSNSIQKDFK